MLWAADATTSTQTGDPIGWINYGVMGLLIAGLVTGIFWVKPAVDALKAERDRAIAERDKADNQRDAMAETFQTQLLPALTEFLTTTRALLPLLQKLLDKTGGER